MNVRSEAFTANECNEVFPGDQPCNNGCDPTLMMEAETVSETSDHNSILTWLTARVSILNLVQRQIIHIPINCLKHGEGANV
jgi:hypothetical protein